MDAPANDDAVEPVRDSDRRVLSTALAALAAAAVLAGGWWLTNPHVMGAGGSMITASLGVNDLVHIASGVYTQDRVTLGSVRAVLAEDSAPADVSVAVCVGGEIGARRGALRQLCDEVRQVEGATLDGYDETVVVSVRPRSAGVVVIEGFDVSYRQGPRFGRERTGVRIEVTAR